MLRDYLRSFWRGVLHNKVATLINIGGLALGLTVFFALSFYVDREFSWDQHWEGADRIYRVAGALESPNTSSPPVMNIGPYVLGTALQSRNPDAFETYVRLTQVQGTLVVGDDEYPSMSRTHAEASLLDLIQVETLDGSLDEVFADPRSIAIADSIAERYFSEESPIGRTISFKAQQSFTGGQLGTSDFVIKAVFNVPDPSTMTMAFLAGFEPTALPQPNARLDIWNNPPQPPPKPGEPPLTPQAPVLSVIHYFKAREGVDVTAMQADLRAYMDDNRFQDNGTSKTRYAFQKLTDVHLMPSLFEPGDNVQRLRVYAAVGVLVLLISGCNFVMLATLRLVDRMREVGIRKSVGGGAGALMSQYLCDAFFHTLVAGTLSVLFLALAFPKLAAMLEFPLQLELLTPRNIALCMAMVVLFTLTSSLYPAWMVSQGKPGPLLRNGASAVVGTGTGLRKLLVGIQFAIVVVLLLASAVVHQQIEYTRNRDRGYSLENVVSTRINSFDLFQKTPALVAEYSKVPGVAQAAVGGISPGVIMITPPSQLKTTAEDGTAREAGVQQNGVGGGFFSVLSVPVLAGREFSSDLDAPPEPTGPVPSTPGILPEMRVVLNASAARLLGFASPEAAIDQLLERTVTTPQPAKQSLRVIGVVADTQFSSAMLPPTPFLYSYSPTNSYVAVKLAPDANVETVTEQLEAVWNDVMNGAAFIPLDMSATNAFTFRREEFEARVITGSTLLAIVIALLGLYGLVAATVVKRVKEIGVRKVMGAEPQAIVTLFLWQFSQPILIANVLAWPFGFWAITQWMQRFPYQIDNFAILLSGLAASILALFIAWLTVGAMAAKAATVKPVLALRYE
jgi:putative ABC transport system permease protein